MTLKAFTYLRVSGKAQAASDRDGLPRQRDEIKSYAAREQIEIVQEFADAGVSGTKDSMDRPGLTDLFVALKANGVRTVLVENATRLARDVIISEVLLREFRKIGCKVISVQGPVDLTAGDDENAHAKLIRQLLAVVSEFEKACIVHKLRVARIRKKQKTGRCEGQKPYGQSETERVVIAEIHRLKALGMVPKRIALELNARGITSRTGKQWHPTQVRRVLAIREAQ